MSLSQETLLELMAYADGELDGDPSARARVEALLASEPEARGVVAAMGALGDEIRAAVPERPFARADGVADAVMDALARGDGAAPVEAPARAPNVVPLGRAPRARATVVAVAVGALALAAGYAFVVRSAVDRVGPAATSGAGPVASTDPAGADPGEGVEVQQVESPDRSVSVIYLPAAAAANVNASTVVVWITDEAPSGDQ